jgi:hypothetical protein
MKAASEARGVNNQNNRRKSGALKKWRRMRKAKSKKKTKPENCGASVARSRKAASVKHHLEENNESWRRNGNGENENVKKRLHRNGEK